MSLFSSRQGPCHDDLKMVEQMNGPLPPLKSIKEKEILRRSFCQWGQEKVHKHLKHRMQQAMHILVLKHAHWEVLKIFLSEGQETVLFCESCIEF